VAGYEFPTTPSLARLAKDAVTYTNAVSVDSCTLPSHASIFTGMYPRQHGAHASTQLGPMITERYRPYFMPLAPSRKTLASYLAAEGYATGAVAGNYARLCRQLGLGQGFQYYHDSPRLMLFVEGGAPVYKIGLDMVDRILGYNGKLLQPYWSAKDVTCAAESWVGRPAAKPFFLFLNYMDPHYPYSAQPPFDHIDGPGIPYNMVMRQASWERLVSQYINTGTGYSAGLRREAINQYDGEVAYTDHWLGALLDWLKGKGLYDDALIIVTADHGEFFGEHQYIDHSVAIYQGGITVPLVVKYPRAARGGETSARRVSNMDIFATVCEAAGAATPGVTAQPLDKTTHPIIVENYENAVQVERYGDKAKRTLTAIFSGDYKYVKSTAGNDELYDLAADPDEAHNLVAAKPDVAAGLDAEIAAWQAKTPAFDARTEVDLRAKPGERHMTAGGDND
jgi:arylsulfatase A-like enzyme